MCTKWAEMHDRPLRACARKEKKMRMFRTACGGTIVVPAKAEDHLRAHPEVEGVLAEAVAKVRLPQNGAFLSAEIEMGRVVGKSGCVSTSLITPWTTALFAQRIGRERASRVVIGEGEETTKVAVLAFVSRGEVGTYVLVTSWVGSLAPKEPWDPKIEGRKEFQSCVSFWCSHALVYDSSVMGEPFESSWEKILK